MNFSNWIDQYIAETVPLNPSEWVQEGLRNRDDVGIFTRLAAMVALDPELRKSLEVREVLVSQLHNMSELKIPLAAAIALQTVKDNRCVDPLISLYNEVSGWRRKNIVCSSLAFQDTETALQFLRQQLELGSPPEIAEHIRELLS